MGWAAGCIHRDRASAVDRVFAIPQHCLLHPPIVGTALSGRKGLGNASNVTTTQFSITLPPSGETLCLSCSFSVTEPCAPLSSSDLLQSTTQSTYLQGNGIRASHCPRAVDPACSKVPLTWACRDEGVGAWRRVLPTWWQGIAHLPGMVVCLPAAPRLGIAFAFASMLKNNPLGCQGYKQEKNKLLSELIKLLSVAAHMALTVRLGRARAWHVNLHSAVPVLIRP